jgi:UrcA family protein
MNSAYRNPRLALLAGALLFSASAWALPPLGSTITRSEAVKYSATEAATPEGAVALYEKLQKAAARVCADPLGTDMRSVTSMAAYSSCVKDALSEAVAAVHVPQVAVIHKEGMLPDAALAKR